jgi:hypothetical protein
MMRKKHITTPVVDENRQAIADFLGLDYLAVIPTEAPGCYTINISENTEAQAIYKKSYPYGNTMIPNHFDFSGEIQVQWTGSKITPA